MTEDPDLDPTCAVCERGLLPGERPIRFVTRAGAEVDVCELCKARAEAAGWLRPTEIEPAIGAAPGRERRRSRGAQVFGGLLSRRGPPDDEPESRPGRPEPAFDDQAAPPAQAPALAGPAGSSIAPSTSVADALHAFNNSDHRRTVAGLTRTLGPPRATAITTQTGSGLPGVRLTIAWELTWYQWEVVPSGLGHDVRESGKGETLDQLRPTDRSWNLMVDADGTLQEKTSTSTPVDGE